MVLLSRFFILILFCLISPLVSAQYAAFRNYLNNEENNSSTIYCAFSDSKGFIWFATEYGVIQFDGKNYRTFTIRNGLSDNEVLRIHEDSKGRIWFLTLNGRLSYHYNGTIYNEQNNQVLNKAGVISTLSAFHEDRAGNLWFGGFHNQILRISEKNELTRFDLKNYQLSQDYFFYETNKGEVLLGSLNNFYRIVSDKVIEPVPFTFKLVMSKGYYASGRGYLLFLAKEGLVEMRDTIQRLLIPREKVPPTNDLNHFFIDSDRNIWITTLGNGVYLIKSARNYTEPYQHFLPGKIITWCTQDQEQNMWFCTVGNGVYMLPANRGNFISYTKEDGLTSDKIYSVYKDNQNNTWLGLDNGQVNQITASEVKQYNLNSNYTPYNRVSDIFIDNQNTIWFGTDMGLLKLLPLRKGNPTRYRPINPKTNEPYSVKSIAESNKGSITFAHASGIEIVQASTKSGSPLQINPLPGIEQTRTFTHFFDQKGNLWYANINGLHQYQDSAHIINHGQNNYLLSRRITALAELADGTLVVGTYGYGLVLYKNGKVLQHITKQNGLAEDICKKVVVQGSVIWVATNNGLTKITLRQNEIVNSYSFRTADGLLSNDIQDIYADKSGIYLATAKGLSILTDAVKKPVSHTPPVYLTHVAAGNQNITNQAYPKLKYYENQFIVSFIGVTFQDPQNVLYLYRLKGINNYWTTTTNNTIEFSALDPGDYVFEVRAKKLDSGWSKPVSFSFRVMPPFWKTWWFILFAIFLLSLLLVLIVQYILSQRLKKQLQQLEMEHKIQRERERIARDLHDNVGSHLTYIVNSLDDTPAAVEPSYQQNHMEHLRDFTKQTITQLRETIWAIRKEKTSVGELKDQLQKMLRQTIMPGHPIIYHYKHDINEALVLTPVQALNIFRIAQEAVTNILKHSQTAVFMISLSTQQDEWLHLLILDEGKGFDMQVKPLEENYGLKNIRDRATEIEALLELESAVGRGTRLLLKLKLTEKIPYTSDIIDKIREQLSFGAHKN